MTPLLDWTFSPYVALFFAFAKADVIGEKDNPYRAVYLLNKTFVEDDERCPEIRLFEPRKDDHGRLVNQAGLFTFSPFDATIENKLTDVLADPEFPDESLRSADEDEQPAILARYICKIYIRNDDRDGCLRHLRRMNVHHASLFPDLIGAAEYCNLLAEEEAKMRFLRKHSIPTSLEPSPATSTGAPAIPPPGSGDSERHAELIFEFRVDSQITPRGRPSGTGESPGDRRSARDRFRSGKGSGLEGPGNDPGSSSRGRQSHASEIWLPRAGSGHSRRATRGTHEGPGEIMRTGKDP